MTAEEAEAARIYDFRNAGGLVDAILVGQNKAGRYIGYRGDGNTMVVAPPGSGKGQGFVVPNCVFYQGSMVVVDPKGENAAMTARHRRENLGQEVHVIDPFGLSGKPTSCFNPLEWLKTTDPNYFMPDCDLIARALVASETPQYTHFSDEAVNLVRGLILYLFAHEPHNLNLNRLYDLAFGDRRYWLAVFELMAESEHGNPDVQRMVRSAGNWYLGLEPKAQDIHRGTAQKNLQWLAGVAIPKVVQTSDFDLRQLKSRPTTVYVCIPGESRELYRPYVRCFVTLALAGMYRIRGVPPAPVQFMCDEFFTTVGHLPIVENAIGDMRGYGARFAFVFQFLSQLKTLYPQNWTAFEGSCGATLYIGVEKEDAKHVSERLGESETLTQPGGTFFAGGDVVSKAPQYRREPLLDPQGVGRLGNKRTVVFMQHQNPLMCDRVSAHSDPRLSPFLDENPMRKPPAALPGAIAPMLGTPGQVRTVDDYLKQKGDKVSKISEALDKILGDG